MKLLIAVDLSELTEKIVKKSEELARKLSAGVWLLHVVHPEPADFYVGGRKPESDGFEMDPQSYRDSLAKRYHSEHRQLQEIADRFRKADLDTTALLVEGDTVETILKEASKLEADMIMVGSHGRGAMHQLLVGSISEGVLQKSVHPVLVIPTHERN